MPIDFQVTFDAHDPKTLSIFWRDALGYVHPPPPGAELEPGEDPLDAWDAFLERMHVPVERRNDSSALVDPSGSRPRIYFQRVPEGKTAKNRLHLDLRAAADASPEERMDALEAVCARHVAAGATRVRRHEPEPPLSLGFIVMQDPEGNEYCLD